MINAVSADVYFMLGHELHTAYCYVSVLTYLSFVNWLCNEYTDDLYNALYYSLYRFAHVLIKLECRRV